MNLCTPDFRAQDQWALMHRNDSYNAMVAASETMWQCFNKSELRRLCLGALFDQGPVTYNMTLNLRQHIESVECFWTVHMYRRGLRAVQASFALGRSILWQYDAAHPGVYGQ